MRNSLFQVPALVVAIAALSLSSLGVQAVNAAPMQDDPTAEPGGKDGQRPQGGGQMPQRKPTDTPETQNGRQPRQQPETKSDADDRAQPDDAANRGANDIPRERAPSPQDIGKPSDAETKATRLIMLEEAKYRNRMAKINRLRELATEQGNEERLQALDKLEARMTELHNRRIERAKTQLGKRFDRVNERLERGRGHAKGKGKPDMAGRGRGASADADESAKKPDGGGRDRDSGQGKTPPTTGSSTTGNAPGRDPGARGGNAPSPKPGAAGGGKPEPKEPAGRGGQSPRGGDDPKGGKGGNDNPRGGNGKGGKP